MQMECKDIAEFQNEIWSFYRGNGRRFPWRETNDPYAVLVSEFMLQQTQTERVAGKYAEWLDAFPSVQELAAAPFAKVLEQWVGLGYNRRARFLHEAAKTIVREHSGLVPSDPLVLETLSGIGAYTAAAVAAFAYNKPTVFIETNIRAVFIHCFFADRTGVSDKEIFPLVEAALDKRNPRLWYYALMDYGAALKKRISNPNRQSRHYAKQSKFEGSVRQARGALLRALTAKNAQTYGELASSDGFDSNLFDKALTALIREGFVAERDGKYVIGSVDGGVEA
ncbi:MAG: A/G-specific adenine glycosylase [Treponema sp.]